MAKFNPGTDMENYSVKGSGYFSLADDGDTAKVRIMYTSADDIEGYSVHKVSVNGYDRWVNCIREYSDPLDACPLCAARYKLQPRFFVPMYIEEGNNQGEVVMWERGAGKNNSFYNQLVELCNANNPLVSHIVEIERNGAKGDFSTTYEMYAGEDDGTLPEDLPEVPDPIGTSILDKTYDELLTFVNTGSFEVGDNNPVNRGNGGNNNPGGTAEPRRRRDVAASNVANRRRGINDGDIPL